MFGTPVIVNATQRALHIRDGAIARVLGPGRYRFRDLGTRNVVELFEAAEPYFASPWLEVLQRDQPGMAALQLAVVKPRADQVGLVSYEGRLAHVVGPGETAGFWTGVRDVGVELRTVAPGERVPEELLHGLLRLPEEQWSKAVLSVGVPAGYEALLIQNNLIRERLGEGLYGFWTPLAQLSARYFDLRRQTLEVAAQEILTRDRVSVRITLTAFWRTADTMLAARAREPVDQLHRQVQFAIRDAVARRTLDELLDARGALDTEMTQRVAAIAAQDGMGLGVDAVAVKDVILPGEMREILNRVVEAEKQAQANLIRRHEETAATRSLLNTARLMENNPLLLRLKELETLERLTEKVERIDFSSHDGLDGMLTRLVSMAGRKGGEQA
jgi:regulator of protease activity HflC (stomatin/prohibitin superfamily)